MAMIVIGAMLLTILGPFQSGVAYALAEQTTLIALRGEVEPTADPMPPPTDEPVPEVPAAARYLPDSGPVTTDFELIASGFTPGERVVEVFTAPGGRRESSTHAANSQGGLQFVIEMDPASPPGAYVSNFTGTSSGAQLSASFTVTR